MPTHADAPLAEADAPPALILQTEDTVKSAASLSIHGASATRRQAASELLFFAGVGDVERCRAVADGWSLDPKTTADYDKRTALHLAAAEGAHSVVLWLLDDVCAGDPNPGAVNALDRFQRTPLEDAVIGDHGAVVAALQQRGGCIWQDGELVPLSASRFAGASRVWGDGGSALLPEWEIEAGALHVGTIIGDGEFGTVHASTWHGGAPIAVKLLKRSDEVAVGDFRTELNVLQKVHHPNTTQFLGAVTRTAPFALVTELVRGGSVADWLRAARRGDAQLPTPRRAAQVALDTARGLLYLHSRHPNPIVHRDLKPGNLLLQVGAHIPPHVDAKAAARAYGICKVADFGLSKTLVMGRAASRADGLAALGEEGGASPSSPGATAAPSGTARSDADVFRMTGETGSYRYMAPEVFRHEPYNFKVDVYSFAIILYELVDGGVPYGRRTHPLDAARHAALLHARPQWGSAGTTRGLRRARRPPPPSELAALVEACWAPDPGERPAFGEVCARLKAFLETAPPDPPARGVGRCAVQ